MSKRARMKHFKYLSEERWSVVRRYRYRKGHPPKAVRGQSGRAVLIINSGIFEVTAKRVGVCDSNRFVCAMARYHMAKHSVREEHYGVYFFQSKREMLRWLVSWHSQGGWKPRLVDFKIEWV